MGIFDPSTFLDATISEASSTTSTPVPEGEYTAVSGEPKIRDGEKDGKPWAALDIPWEIDGGAYPNVKEETGRDKAIVQQSIFLDLAADGRSLDMGKGKNVNLGRLREALGMNKPGQPFSVRMLQGRVAKISVKHRMYQEQVFADVKGVAAA